MVLFNSSKESILAYLRYLSGKGAASERTTQRLMMRSKKRRNEVISDGERQRSAISSIWKCPAPE